MESCGITALTGTHSDVRPFSSTLWNLLLKKLSIKRNRESATPTDLSLYIIFHVRLYQKPQEYQEIQHQSQEQDKHQKRCISYVQLTKADLHLSHLTERQIDGLIDNSLLSPRQLYKLTINLLNILPETGNNQTTVFITVQLLSQLEVAQLVQDFCRI